MCNVPQPRVAKAWLAPGLCKNKALARAIHTGDTDTECLDCATGCGRESWGQPRMLLRRPTHGRRACPCPCPCRICVAWLDQTEWQGKEYAVGVWRVACGVWRVACGVWRVACGVWRVACGVWRVACAGCGAIGIWLCMPRLCKRKHMPECARLKMRECAAYFCMCLTCVVDSG